MTKTKKVILDTNLYIDWIRGGQHTDSFIAAGSIRYLSSVVIMELFAGAINPIALSVVRDILRTYERVGRVLTPSSKTYEESGLALATLRKKGFTVSQPGFVNDVLIAMTARQFGATVVTRNRDDFERIKAARPFALQTV